MAGIEGEQLVAGGFGRVLNDEWTLIRGYRNRRGEIDHLLLGPHGLVAIEGKHRNALVHCAGDHWWFTKFDKYGNAVERGEMTDSRGRSPSQQVNEPASQLESFLRTRGHPVAIQRVVLLTHPRSRLGNCVRPTVHVATTTGQVLGMLGDSATALSQPEREQVERLIIRDHRFHASKRKP
ncbi:MAG TPA: nuclease-related domain-containing protein [Streptosporangiaceae bacterium]|nr:nuclease-related domain-containing protein [Streptosporangiaceae bacterium]